MNYEMNDPLREHNTKNYIYYLYRKGLLDQIISFVKAP